MRILIADDDRDITTLLNTAFRAHGWDVFLAFDAAQALVHAKNTTPDIIILDINMPGGTGIGALEKLRMNMKTAMIPILVVTGSNDKSVEKKARELGISGYIHKPVAVETLCDRLMDIVKAA